MSNTQKSKIATIIGARPQFIKHSVLEPELKNHFSHISMHSGQHYDDEMSEVFFQELNIDPPGYFIESKDILQKEQITHIIKETEKILFIEKPDLVIVYGDTNTTLAGALAASKLKIPIAHIEAGMRSFNDEMPEEGNRIATDQLSCLLFTSSEQSVFQLKMEGITKGVVNSGDLMKDLVFIIKEKGLLQKTSNYSDKIYCTIHRPYNTDQPERLKNILDQLNILEKKVVFSLHPRTKKMMDEFHLPLESFANIEFIKPQSYLNNLNNIYNFDSLITDSGGMQKEAYFLKKRCITIRTETEWTETLNNNWNTLVFDNLDEIKSILGRPLGAWNEHLYGDGNARKKIINGIIRYLNSKNINSTPKEG